MFLESAKKEECCGCMACSQICSFSAIEMKQDERGFFYPELDRDKCVNCGKCRKVCPIEENYVGQEADPEIYAVRIKDKDILRESSSGGMFSVLAYWVLKQQGVIYGVAFDESFSVRHTRADSEQGVKRFRGSKYVESDMSQVYLYICRDLQAGKIVLLTGTPCQISAVTKFLRQKRVNMERLYTCDNICHGVPSRKVWKEYLDILKKKYISENDEIVSIHMRSKKESWKKQVMDIQLKSGNLDLERKMFSWNRFYLSLFANRSSCFQCRYTSYKRPSDFTLGDFWNVERANLSFCVENGVNVALVNTIKGKKLFELLKEEMEVQTITKQQCWQPHLEYSARRPSKQEQFWEEFRNTSDKEVILHKYMKGSLLNQIIKKSSPLLRRMGLYTLMGKLYKVFYVRNEK